MLVWFASSDFGRCLMVRFWTLALEDPNVTWDRHFGQSCACSLPSKTGAEAHCNMIGAHQCLMTYLGVDQKTLTISHHCSAQFPIISGQRCCSISKSWILSVGRSWAADVRKPDAIVI